MLDINLIRENPDVVRAALQLRNIDTDVISRILDIDQQRRSLLTRADSLKSERNTVSKEISQVKDPAERKTKIEAMRIVGDQIAVLDEQIRKVEADQVDLLSGIPNIPAVDTPIGKDDSENIVVRVIGELPAYNFTPIPHWDLGPALGIINFDQGVKITGSRFYVLSGAGARLERALISYMLDPYPAGVSRAVSAVHGQRRCTVWLRATPKICR